MRRWVRTLPFIGLISSIIGVGLGGLLWLGTLSHGEWAAVRNLPQSGNLVHWFMIQDGQFVPGLSFADFEGLAREKGLFPSTTYLREKTALSKVGGKAGFLRVSCVAGDYAALCPPQVALGRFLLPQETAPVVVLSESAFRRYCGGDASWIGRLVELNGHPFTLVGVVAKHSPTLELNPSLEGWIPFEYAHRLLAFGELNERDHPAYRPMSWVFSRVAGGLGRDAAQAAGARAIGNANPTAAGCQMRLQSWSSRVDSIINRRYPALTILWWLCGLFMLLALTTVIGLVSLRVASQGAANRIKCLLGAHWLHLVREVLPLLAAISLACVALALITRGLLIPLLSPRAQESLPWSQGILLGSFTFLVMILIHGIAIGRQYARRQGPVGNLQDSKTWVSSRGRKGLLGLQYALSFLGVYLAYANLREFRKQSTVPLGMSLNGVWAFQVPSGGGGGGASLEAIQARLGNLPGVGGTALCDGLPLSGNLTTTNYQVRAGEEPIHLNTLRCDRGYGPLLGLKLLGGRWFHPGETTGLLLTHTMAQHLWPGENPLGKTLNQGSLQVVGIVDDFRFVNALGPQTPMVLRAAPLQTRSSIYLLASARGPEGEESLRNLTTLPGSDLVAAPQSLRAGYEAQLRPSYTAMAISGFVGILGFLITSVGSYQLLAMVHRQREKESAIKLALGAQPLRLAWELSRELGVTALGGLLVGFLVLSALLRATKTLAGALAGPGATVDLALAGGTGLLLAGMAVVLSLRWLYRIHRMEPAEWLRGEG